MSRFISLFIVFLITKLALKEAVSESELKKEMKVAQNWFELYCNDDDDAWQAFRTFTAFYKFKLGSEPMNEKWFPHLHFP